MKSEFKVINLSETTMTIEAIGSDGCQSCQKSVGCGSGNSIFKVPKRADTLLGDKIYIEVGTNTVIINGFFTYMLPIFMLFVGAIYASETSESNELTQILYGFVGFFIAIIFNKLSQLLNQLGNNSDENEV